MTAPSVPVYICIRQTVEWRDEAAFRAQLNPGFAPKVETWNRTFTMPFHVFRHRVREIARANLAAVRGAVCADWGTIPDGALVVPSDDDDWFAPDLVQALEDARDPAAAGYYWISTYVEVPRNARHRCSLLLDRLLPWRKPIWTCSSNNYVFVKGAYVGTWLLKHTQADAWFKGAGASQVRRIDRRLSVQNRTLASITSMGWKRSTVEPATLIRKYHAYRRLYAKGAPPGVEWCEPYIAAMAQLMNELRPRER